MAYSEFTNGEYKLTGIPIGSYVVYETNANQISPMIRLLSSSVTVGETTVAEGKVGEVSLTNNYESPVTAVVVMKMWDDGDNLDGARPSQIVMTLSNGQKVTLNEGNSWMAQIDDLPMYDEKGATIEYTWTEEQVAEYRLTGQTTLGNTTVFTNSHEPNLVSTSVTKIWDDENNAAGLRPATLRVRLSNGRSYTLSAANNWTVTVENLPKYNNGVEIKYTWSEQTVLGYTQEIRVVGDVTIFTNHYHVLTPPPPGGGGPGKPRTPVYVFEDYDTPLAVEVEINHVGDCFD